MLIRQVLLDFFDQSWFTLKFIDQMQKFICTRRFKKENIGVPMKRGLSSFSPGEKTSVSKMSDAKSYVIHES